MILLTISSSIVYYAEHGVQPDKFSDIPAAMWWSVTTLTTVGYGDLYPISAVGKVLGAVVAIFGIGLFALPTDILGTGYIEAMTDRREREAKKKAAAQGPKVCPHCGQPLEWVH